MIQATWPRGGLAESFGERQIFIKDESTVSRKTRPNRAYLLPESEPLPAGKPDLQTIFLNFGMYAAGYKTCFRVRVQIPCLLFTVIMSYQILYKVVPGRCYAVMYSCSWYDEMMSNASYYTNQNQMHRLFLLPTQFRTPSRQACLQHQRQLYETQAEHSVDHTPPAVLLFPK